MSVNSESSSPPTMRVLGDGRHYDLSKCQLLFIIPHGINVINNSVAAGTSSRGHDTSTESHATSQAALLELLESEEGITISRNVGKYLPVDVTENNARRR